MNATEKKSGSFPAILENRFRAQGAGDIEAL